jgi:(2S)-methylsuccinyl-CoA dehydrogenase
VDVSLEQTRTLIQACRTVVDRATARLAADSAKDGRIDVELMDREQLLAYDLATIASQVAAAEEMVAYAEQGELEALLTAGFAGEVAAGLAARMEGREAAWGVEPGADWHSDEVREALRVARSIELLEAVAERVLGKPEMPRHLDGEFDMARQTFKDYADAKVKPVAEHVHRNDEDIPDDIIEELAGMGVFGLSIPEQFGGFAQGESENDFMSMVVVTEELSRGSLGVAGSLITRPEILSKALVKGGTPEQQQRWLPKIAAGELMCGVAVTEPDFGSDVANLKVSARRDGDFFVVNGVKTWCTFGGRANLLMLLARTGSREEGHRGLSLFVVEKPSYPGHAFTHEGEHGGTMEARAIGTIGYRGMHSFEISFDDYRVPAENLVGGEEKLGKGFYLQMDAFANGRLQTAARALGVMQAAFEDAVTYANDRHVFGVPLAGYQLTRAKLAKMAFMIAACRRFSYRSAQLLGAGEGQLEASMVKAFSCLAAEWVTREAQQIHGGMGYAEEYAVSRYFVDARVLSIFEGADEVLALRVIIRRLLEGALKEDRTDPNDP